ncbi:hypothetical protein M405DRAFT_859571 [Rhizopogon salebrosus TDB-379]|nr:hypothetical protein M405DRAFT_859571 [Rhizopogon salebrosus TDB-379]
MLYNAVFPSSLRSPASQCFAIALFICQILALVTIYITVRLFRLLTDSNNDSLSSEDARNDLDATHARINELMAENESLTAERDALLLERQELMFASTVSADDPLANDSLSDSESLEIIMTETEDFVDIGTENKATNSIRVRFANYVEVLLYEEEEDDDDFKMPFSSNLDTIYESDDADSMTSEPPDISDMPPDLDISIMAMSKFFSLPPSPRASFSGL